MFITVNEFVENYQKYPVYLIFGEEEFLIDEAFREIIDNLYIRNDNFDLDLLEAENITVNDILKIAFNYPFSSSQRTVIVKKAEKLFSSKSSKKNEELNRFIEYLNNPSNFTNLILIAQLDKLKDLKKNLNGNTLNSIGINKLKDINPPFNIIIEKYHWTEYPKIYENEYPNFIKERLTSKNKTISNEALNYLILQCSNSLRELNEEIEKLCIYKGEKQEITYDDVVFVSGTNKEYNVFELQKSVAERNLKKSIEILNKLLENDSQEMLIISILLKLFINSFKFIELKAIVADENILAKEMGLQKWQLKDYHLISQKYKIEEVEQAIVKITECDYNLKSGYTNTMAIMQNLLNSIII